MQKAENESIVGIGKKDCTIINAFHPSTFAKGLKDGPLYEKGAVEKAALLEFYFLRAIRSVHGNWAPKASSNGF